MIKEFAVEPAAIVESALRFQYVIEKFGISEGRVISEFPAKWKKLVYEAAQQEHHGKTELTKILEKIKHLPKNALISLARPAGTGDWLDIVKAEHQRQPFDWVLTKSPEEIGQAVHLDAWDAGHPSLQNQRQERIARTAEEMARVCRPLLRVAKHVKLVDPHFDLNNLRYREPLARFIECLPENACIDIFVAGLMLDGTRDHLLNGANRFLPQRLHRGMQVKLWGHAKGRMHNRYVLSQLGGLFFGVGLDMAVGDATPMDEVTLLEERIRVELWSEYADGELIGTWRG
ncbi:hypothetical protein ACG97_11885 [Vogesella sp. EB]|uniref:hypothetical protein n=1 Tax=Vogesella sp. EB TaxID=1526735 RepID=UPI00064D0B47|nr:hypothetical protein [Vogesella sp. EB]KMJ52762.1 hypothetical protein ACG97_11885 [Vogesella sp. EB]